MLELYKVIEEELKPIVTAYAEHYPTTLEKVYPYVEYTLPYSNPNNTYSDNHLLYVDIWDNKSGSVVEIENITDKIEKALNRLQINNETMQVCIYKNNPCRFPVPDTEINIQRRELRFICRVYEK